MPNFELTAEQLEVILSEEASLVVTASAGAGKTSVLVQRYLRCVERGLEPDAMLTITFTKKAAAEMKRRIVSSLRDKGLMRQAQAAETGPIQTIHSLCERLLRENALAAGLDPRFQIAAGSEATEMVEQAVRHALSTDFEQPEAEALIAFLAGRRSYHAGYSPYALLEEAIKGVLERFRGSGLPLEEFEEQYTQGSFLEALYERKIAEHLPLPVAEHLKRCRTGSLGERLQAAYRDWGEKAPRWVGANPDPETDQEALRHGAGLFQICACAWRNLERQIERNQTLDFTALESRALDLLTTSQPTRERIRDQYKVVMVDEVQDLNRIQHDILDHIDPDHLMLVGDVQQSIFGFRLADPDLFQARIGEHAMRLSVNKRSGAGILQFVDRVFGSLWPDYVPMTPPPAPIDLEVVELPGYPGVELWPQADKDVTRTALLIRDMLREHALRLGDVALLVRDHGFAQEIQTALRSLDVPSRIAGGTERFYARLEIRDLANILRALANPYDDFALLAMLRSPAVGLSLDAFALLALDRPVIEALDRFVSPIDDDRAKLNRFLEWYTPLRGVADRLSAWEVLSELFAVSNYLAQLARRPNAPQALANVRKLLRLAAECPELGPLEFAERIREIQRLGHREGDAPAEDERADVITITTIHKAKGLEWPTVIVPQMHRSMGKRASEIEVDPRLRIAATKFGKRPSIYYRWLTEQRGMREVEEELRLLYVAFTRAKERLCVVLHPSAPAESPARRIAQVIGFAKSPPGGFVIRHPAEEEANPA